MRLIDPFSLDCILAIAQEGTFRKAARRLNVTPSAVSQRVSALEARVGAVLVKRIRPISLTAAGQAVLRYAQRVQIVTAQLEQGLIELAQMHDCGAQRTITEDSTHVCAQTWPALENLALGRPPIPERYEQADSAFMKLLHSEIRVGGS